jgi:hypothetical protein
MEHTLAVTVNGSINHVPTTENRLRCEELASEISLLSGHLNAANYRLLKLIAEFDARTGWSNEGAQSCAHWLNWKCGVGMGADLFAQHEDIRIDDRTAVTLWDGTRCDYELGVWVLMQKGKIRPAGTFVGREA